MASVLVNGSPTDEFPMKRGLRQGDPLSPFLFLLVVEGFNILMKSMSEKHFFHSYKVGPTNATVVSHLQFADDTLIIVEKSWANVRAMRVVLSLFETISELKVNFTKSQLIGVNVHGSWLTEASFSGVSLWRPAGATAPPRFIISIILSIINHIIHGFSNG